MTVPPFPPRAKIVIVGAGFAGAATAYALAQADGAEPWFDAKDAPGARALTPLQAAKLQYDGLTARERQVAALIAQGKSNSAIASELGYSDQAHLTRAFRRWTGETPAALLGLN